MDYFNRAPRPGTLSPVLKDGVIDSAVFGSPQMIDDTTMVMGLWQNRTPTNLPENPAAVLLIMEPGKTLADWKGVGVYLKKKVLAVGGPSLDTCRVQIAKTAGPDAAKMIPVVVTFDVTEIRPLLDRGQD
jgi:hypothetical protein